LCWQIAQQFVSGKKIFGHGKTLNLSAEGLSPDLFLGGCLLGIACDYL